MPPVEQLIRKHLRKIETYSPVDPSEELARSAGIRPEEVIRLNANENPFGPSPKVHDAIRRAALHLYPDPLQRRVRASLSEYTGVPVENLLAGAGGDEIIDLIMRLFVEPGERVLDCDPTFGMYSFCARIANAEVVSVPRTNDFEVDLDAVASEDDDHTKVLFLASPNNPTGNMLTEDQARRLLALNFVLVVDETYHEFSGQTLAPLVREYENLVILRSMSKWAGLAGLRIGYMIGSREIVNHLIDIKQPYNVSIASEAALLASLDHRESLMKNVRVLLEQRWKLEAAIDEIDGIQYWPSHGNFLLCEFEREAKSVYSEMAKRGVFVRVFSHPMLPRHLRISVGTPEQTGRLIEVLRQVT